MKDKYQPSNEWWNNFRILMGFFKMLVFLITAAVLYLSFEEEFKTLIQPRPVPTVNPLSPSPSSDDWEKVENGIHIQTGLIAATGFDQVSANCTVCHSAKLITQNRASREGWSQMIDWMQETQGLWDLGKDRTIILDYLAKHYKPLEKGRRENIDVAEIEWYILELEED